MQRNVDRRGDQEWCARNGGPDGPVRHPHTTGVLRLASVIASDDASARLVAHLAVVTTAVVVFGGCAETAALGDLRRRGHAHSGFGTRTRPPFGACECVRPSIRRRRCSSCAGPFVTRARPAPVPSFLLPLLTSSISVQSLRRLDQMTTSVEVPVLGKKLRRIRDWFSMAGGDDPLPVRTPCTHAAMLPVNEDARTCVCPSPAPAARRGPTRMQQIPAGALESSGGRRRKIAHVSPYPY